MSPIDLPSTWNPVPHVDTSTQVPEVETADVNKVVADAMTLAMSQPAHPTVPPSTVAPLPDESVARLQHEKGSAAGEVMHVLAGSDSGSIENLVNQALANRPPQQGPPPSPEERARLARRVSQAIVGREGEGEGDGDEGTDADDEGGSVQDILRAGARVLRRAPLQLRRALRG